MDDKFYVSYEAARLLKEKGYNEATDYSIDEDNCMMDSRYVLNKDLSEYACSCPTKSEAIDWLDSKGVVVIVDISFSDGTWIYSIYREGEHLYDSIISKESCFSTRLEAEEAAIIKALELL